jgi:uncharacterized protein DUF4446
VRFSGQTLSILVLVSLGLAAIALLLTLGRSLIEGWTSRSLPPDKRLEAQLDTHAKALKRLEGAVRQLAVAERQLSHLAEISIRHVGVVRFDAFEDMGGRLSFSAALLDGLGNGLVVTSINGRQESRCYAKPVAKGTSVHNLSDEERQAIREALGAGAPREVAEAR